MASLRDDEADAVVVGYVAAAIAGSYCEAKNKFLSS